MIEARPPRRVTPGGIDTLPLGSWIRHRFGLGHRLSLAALGMVFLIWVTRYDPGAAPSMVQAFVLLVLFPMVVVSPIYGIDAAIAVAHRLGLASRPGLRARRMREPRVDPSSQNGPDEPAATGYFGELAAEHQPVRRLAIVLAFPMLLAIVIAIVIVVVGPRQTDFDPPGWALALAVGGIVAVAGLVAGFIRRIGRGQRR